MKPLGKAGRDRDEFLGSGTGKAVKCSFYSLVRVKFWQLRKFIRDKGCLSLHSIGLSMGRKVPEYAWR
jgi:hypothetical protein